MIEFENGSVAAEMEDDPGFEAILEHADYVDSGKDGIVLRLENDHLTDEERNFLKRHGVDFEGTAAVKVLKIYGKEKAEREFAIHQKAWEVLSQRQESVSPLPIASTPRPYQLKDVRLSKERVGKLNSMGTELTDRAGFLVMDFVHGDSLLTLLAKIALVIKDPETYSMNVLDRNLSENVEMIARREFAADLIQNESILTPQEKAFFLRNLLKDKLKAFLMRHKAKVREHLPSGGPDAIRRAISQLHRNGIYHNDLHEKNLMITPEGYQIIDYGRAADEPITRENQTSDGFVGIEDNWIAGFLDAFYEESTQIQDSPAVKEYLEIKSRIANGSKQYQDLLLRSKKGIRMIAYMLESGIPNGGFPTTMAVLVKLLESGELNTELEESVRAYLIDLPNQMLIKRSNDPVKKLTRFVSDSLKAVG